MKTLTKENKTTEVKKSIKDLSFDAIQNNAVLDCINENSLSEFLFPVEKVETSELIPNIKPISEYAYSVIGNIAGEKCLLNSCSSKYELIPNADFLPVIINTLQNAKINFSVNGSSNDDHTEFKFDFNIENHDIIIGENDRISPRFTIIHSYNGKLDYSLQFGFFRFICSNGLVIPADGTAEFNLIIKGKHTSSILFSFETLIEKLNYFINNVDAFLNPYKKLQENKVSDLNERIETLFEKTGIKNPGNKALDHIKERVYTEQSELQLNHVNDWLIYNGFNHYIHNTNKKNPNVRTALDHKVLETMLS